VRSSWFSVARSQGDSKTATGRGYITDAIHEGKALTRTRQRENAEFSPALTLRCFRLAPPLAEDCRESGNLTMSPVPHATAMGSRVRRDTSAEVIKPELTPSKREAHPFSCSHPQLFENIEEFTGHKLTPVR
jgi:hypothetical protein